MTILGVILLVIGFIAKIAIIWAIGIIVVVGARYSRSLGSPGMQSAAGSIPSECGHPRMRK